MPYVDRIFQGDAALDSEEQGLDNITCDDVDWKRVKNLVEDESLLSLFGEGGPQRTDITQNWVVAALLDLA